MASPAARPFRPRLTAAEGPREKQAHRARQRQEQQQSSASLPAIAPSPACRGGLGWGALDLAVASARRSALLYPGPLWRGGRVEESPQDGPHGCGPVFRRDRSPVEKPRNPPAHPQGRMPGGRAIGVAFLFGSFLFGHAKRKELGHRQVDETALKLAKAREQRPPLPHPLSHKCERGDSTSSLAQSRVSAPRGNPLPHAPECADHLPSRQNPNHWKAEDQPARRDATRSGASPSNPQDTR